MDGIKQAREDFAAVANVAAAATVDEGISLFAPGSRMSKYAHWFVTSDDAVLIAVVAPEEPAKVADEVLAFGLAWQGNRDLHLILPGQMIAGTLGRLPWIEAEVRVWVLEGGQPQPVRTLPRIAVMERLRELEPRVSRKGRLSNEQESWLLKLDLSGLEPHDRSYRSWHHQGLQVLKATKSRKGLRIQAGVQYSNPKPGQEPYDRYFDAETTMTDVADINREIGAAVVRGTSLTSQMREHRMQATLSAQAKDLGLTRLWREFPAYRGMDGSKASGGGRRGFIDFLAIDSEGRFHIVETKVGHDPRVVLQALDYAIWVRANEREIRAQLRSEGWDVPDPKPRSDDRLRLHLVLAPGKNGIAFNGYLAPQIDALSGDCAVQVHLVSDPAASPLILKRLSAKDVWNSAELVAAPVGGPRRPEMLSQALLEDEV